MSVLMCTYVFIFELRGRRSIVQLVSTLFLPFLVVFWEVEDWTLFLQQKNLWDWDPENRKQANCHESLVKVEGKIATNFYKKNNADHFGNASCCTYGLRRWSAHDCTFCSFELQLAIVTLKSWNVTDSIFIRQLMQPTFPI